MAMNASRAVTADDDDAPVFAEMGSETTDHFHTKVEAGNYTGARTHTLKCAYRDLLIISGKKSWSFLSPSSSSHTDSHTDLHYWVQTKEADVGGSRCSLIINWQATSERHLGEANLITVTWLPDDGQSRDVLSVR